MAFYLFKLKYLGMCLCQSISNLYFLYFYWYLLLRAIGSRHLFIQSLCVKYLYCICVCEWVYIRIYYFGYSNTNIVFKCHKMLWIFFCFLVFYNFDCMRVQVQKHMMYIYQNTWLFVGYYMPPLPPSGHYCSSHVLYFIIWSQQFISIYQ